MNSLEFVLLSAVVVLAVFAGTTAWKLFKSGTPKQALPGQVALKAEGIADNLADQILAAIARQNEKRQLKDAYFDRDELISDIARLPASYTRTVKLDGAIKREGSGEPLEYLTQVNGNVTKQ